MTLDQMRRGSKTDNARRTRFQVNRPIRFERNWLNKESNASSRNLLVEISSQRPNRSRRRESLTRVRKKNSQDKVKLASLPREKSSWYSSRDPLPRTNLPRLKISHGIHSTAMCAPRNELAISRHRSTCCGVCSGFWSCLWISLARLSSAAIILPFISAISWLTIACLLSSASNCNACS